MTAIVNGSSSNLSGTISYNGWAFNGPRFQWKIDMVPVKSGDNRTVLYNKYLLTVRAIVTDDYAGTQSHIGGTLQKSTYNARSNLQKIRSLLSKNGKALIIQGLGYDIRLNDQSYDGIYDVRWGPTTKALRIEPIGNGVVFQIDWVLEFCLPECFSTTGLASPAFTAGTGDITDVSYIRFPYTTGVNTPAFGKLESLVFEVNYGIDKAGLTTRVISGYGTIALNRANTIDAGQPTSTITSTCDEIRELITPEIPENFQRLRSDWTLSTDRMMLTFQIVDGELPSQNSFPPGVHDMMLDHAVHIKGSNLSVSANSPGAIYNRFSGFIDVVKYAPMGLAFDKVILMVQERINAQKENGGANDQTVFITSIDLVETIIGPTRRLTFSIAYEVKALSSSNLFGNLITRTALFNDVNFSGTTITNHTLWSSSMKDKVWSQRGLAGLEFQANQDAIVGPCDGNPSSNTADYAPAQYLSSGGGSLVSDCPTGPKSYEAYKSEIYISNSTGLITHMPMTSTALGPATNQTIRTASGPDAPISKYFRQPPSSMKPRIQNLSAGSKLTFCIEGAAIRLGAWPEEPAIDDATFNSAVSSGSLGVMKPEFRYQTVGRRGTCIRYAMYWKICYVVTLTQPASISSLLQAIKDSLITTPIDPNRIKAGGD